MGRLKRLHITALSLGALLVCASAQALTPTPSTTETPTNTATPTPTITPGARVESAQGWVTQTLCTGMVAGTCGPVFAGPGHKSVKVAITPSGGGTPTPAVKVQCDAVHGDGSPKTIATLNATGTTGDFLDWCDDLQCDIAVCVGACSVSCSLRVWGEF